MIEYEELKRHEEVFIAEILKRKGLSGRKILARVSVTKIAKVVERPYVMVSIKWPDTTTNGFSKQCTYAPIKDSWNEETGIKIAMSRAIRNYIED